MIKPTCSLRGESRLKQAITGPALFLFILGDVLDAGVYALVGKIAGEAGRAVWVPLLVAPHCRTPTLLPVLAMISCLLLSQQGAGTWLRAGLLMALGALLYGIGHWRKGRATVSVD